MVYTSSIIDLINKSQPVIEWVETIPGKEDDLLEFKIGSFLYLTFYHEQDCCETVYLVDDADVIKQLKEIKNEKLLKLEEKVVTKETEEADSMTSTFYTLTTDKRVVDFRFEGISNGYYSEHVDLRIGGY